MALIAPLEGREAFTWKKCNTASQSCVCCGESMTKGEIAFHIKNAHDKKKTKHYLWVHTRCVDKLGIHLGQDIQNERINKLKNAQKQIGCVLCGNTVRKGQIHIQLSNASDRIATKKRLWIHRKCAPTLASEIKTGLACPTME